jgi:hypothetical protein
MDELDLLTRHRPDAPPPTDDERATARAAVMAHIATSEPTETADPVIDLAASPRRDRRTLRRTVALAGAAAAVVALVLVAGGSDRAPSPLQDRPATAAEQLEAIADVVAPYPDTPFAVRVRSVDRWVGPKGRTDRNEAVVHHARPDVWVSDTSGCETPCLPLIFPSFDVLPFAPDADPAAVRAGIEDTVRARTEPDDDDEFVVQSRLSYLGDLLRHPAAGPTARAEIMRMLAEDPDLTATPGERSASGAEGTLFRFTRSTGGETMLLIDPSDGYVLESRYTAPAVDPDVVPGLREDGVEVVTLVGSPEGDYSSVTTYDRPVAGPLPDEVVALAAEAAEKAPAGIAGTVTDPPGLPQCIGEVGPTTGEDELGVPVPDGLAFVFCGLP